MCGRYILKLDREAFIRFYGFDPVEEFSETRIDPFRPRYNVAPSQRVPIVRSRLGPEREIIRQGTAGSRELVMARWGLIPGWAKEPSIGNKMINARCETVATNGAFRSAFASRRCIVPASGFYEWKGAKPPKQPYLVRRVDGEPMAFAGLWETWTDRATGEVVTTCTIITCEANALIAELHDRMPVILDPDDYDRWIGQGDRELLRPCPVEWLEACPVGPRVNRPENDGADLIQPLDDHLLL
jgi:putative SOS response-associated peptidase YedK